MFRMFFAQRCGDKNTEIDCDILKKSEYDDLISTKLNELNALVRKSTSSFESEIEKIQIRKVT